MAKVKFPLMSGEVSGKIGDVVFMQRHGQAIVRRRTKPSNPKTAKQLSVRNNMSALSQAWKGSGSLVRERREGSTTIKYVILKKKNMDNTYTEIEFPVLTDNERMAWEDKAKATKGYKSYGRMLFVGENIKALNNSINPKRTP